MCVVPLAALAKQRMTHHLQALTTALSGVASSAASETLTAYDEAAAQRAEERVAALRAALPAASSVRALCESSEIKPHIQVGGRRGRNTLPDHE